MQPIEYDRHSRAFTIQHIVNIVHKHMNVCESTHTYHQLFMINIYFSLSAGPESKHEY